MWKLDESAGQRKMIDKFFTNHHSSSVICESCGDSFSFETIFFPPRSSPTPFVEPLPLLGSSQLHLFRIYYPLWHIFNYLFIYCSVRLLLFSDCTRKGDETCLMANGCFRWGKNYLPRGCSKLWKIYFLRLWMYGYMRNQFWGYGCFWYIRNLLMRATIK